MTEANTQNIFIYSDHLYFIVQEPTWPDTNNMIDERNVTFICHKHGTPLVVEDTDFKNRGFELVCPLCEQDYDYEPMSFPNQKYGVLQRKALASLDRIDFKNAKFIRVNEFYTPEIKKFNVLKKSDTPYSIKADVKTDANGDTIVILYLGYKGDKKKTQLFIKPEKLQLSHDFKDMDPAAILAKVELTLRDRTITQNYDN